MRLHLLYSSSPCPADYYRPNSSSTCIPCPRGLSSDGTTARCLSWFEQHYGTAPEPDQYDSFENFWSNITLRADDVDVDPDHTEFKKKLKTAFRELNEVERAIEGKTKKLPKSKLKYSPDTLEAIRAAMPIINNPYPQSYLTESEKWDAKVGLITALENGRKNLEDPSLSEIDALTRTGDTAAILKALLDPTKPLVFPNRDNNCYIGSLVQSLLSLRGFERIVSGQSDTAKALHLLHGYKSNDFKVQSLDHFRSTLANFHHFGKTIGGTPLGVFCELVHTLPSLNRATLITALDMSGNVVEVHTLQAQIEVETISSLVTSFPMVGYSTVEGSVALTKFVSLPEVLWIRARTSGDIKKAEFKLEIKLSKETKVYTLQAVIQLPPDHAYAHVYNQESKSWYEINNSESVKILDSAVVDDLSVMFLYQLLESIPNAVVEVNQNPSEDVMLKAAVQQMMVFGIQSGTIKFGEDFARERLANETHALMKRLELRKIPGAILFAGYNPFHEPTMQVIYFVHMLLALDGLKQILLMGQPTDASTYLIDVIRQRDEGNTVVNADPFIDLGTDENPSIETFLTNFPGLFDATAFKVVSRWFRTTSVEHLLDCSRCNFSDKLPFKSITLPTTLPKVLLLKNLREVPPESITLGESHYDLRAIQGRDGESTRTAVWNSEDDAWSIINPFMFSELDYSELADEVPSNIVAIYEMN